MIFLSSADFFFKIYFFIKFFKEHHHCQMIWVQTVCKCYQQMTLVGKELKNDSLHMGRPLVKSEYPKN